MNFNRNDLKQMAARYRGANEVEQAKAYFTSIMLRAAITGDTYTDHVVVDELCLRPWSIAAQWEAIHELRLAGFSITNDGRHDLRISWD